MWEENNGNLPDTTSGISEGKVKMIYPPKIVKKKKKNLQYY